MLPMIQADRPSAGGDAAQQQARRHHGIASEENLTASSCVSGEQFIQWQQRIATTRREKEEKVKQDSMAVESSAQRVRQLKTENEQLVGRENQLSEESKMEEVLLVETNAQLGVLEKQLEEAGGLGRFVRQLQEEEEKTKLERTSRVRDIEERLRRMQLSESEARAKLDEAARSMTEKLKENSTRDKQGLDAVKETHRELVEAKSKQTCQRRNQEIKLESIGQTNKEQGEKAEAMRNLISSRRLASEAMAMESDKNSSYLESLLIKVGADEESENTLLMGLKDRKSLAQEKMSKAEKEVDQLQRTATERQYENVNLKEKVNNLEAVKAKRLERATSLRENIIKLKEVANVAEQAFMRERAAEEKLADQKKTQQEKFREEEKRVELHGQLQLTGEQLTKKNVELEALESQVRSEKSNLQKITEKAEASNEVLRDLMANNDKLQSISIENQETLTSLETKLKGASENLGFLKVENDRIREMTDSLTTAIADVVEQNEFSEEQLRIAEAEKIGVAEAISPLESEIQVLVEGLREAQEGISSLEDIMPVKEEELRVKKERSTSLTALSNQLLEEKNAALAVLEERTAILKTIGCDIDQINSRTADLKVEEEELVRQVAQALDLLEQGTKTQALRGAHDDDLKKVKKLQRTIKQAKSELNVVLKKKEKLEKQCVKTTLEKSKLMEDVEHVETELRNVKDSIATLSASQVDHGQVLLTQKGEMEQCRLEAEELAKQSQVLKNRVEELNENIRQSEALLRNERGKVEEQKMVLEEKQRKGKVGLTAIEAECSAFDEKTRTMRNHFEQKQHQKKQLVDDLEKAEREGERLKQELEVMEKASASHKTTQQLRRSGSGKNVVTPLPLVKRKEVETEKEISKQLNKKTGKENGTQEGFTQFRTPSSVSKKVPLQANKSSPSTSRGKRALLPSSILQPPKTPNMASKGLSILKVSPAVKSPFEVASLSESSE